MIENGYIDLVSPFGLPRPSKGWLDAVLKYDDQIVIFPSQQQAVFRICRRRKRSVGLTGDLFKKLPVPASFVPDTQILVHYELVPLPWALQAQAVRADPALTIATLWKRDSWDVFGGPDGGDRHADHLDRAEVEQEQTDRANWKKEQRVRHRASRVAYQYRTGARISLVSPRRRTPAPATATVSPPTAATTEGSPVSAPEV